MKCFVSGQPNEGFFPGVKAVVLPDPFPLPADQLLRADGKARAIGPFRRHNGDATADAIAEVLFLVRIGAPAPKPGRPGLMGAIIKSEIFQVARIELFQFLFQQGDARLI